MYFKAHDLIYSCSINDIRNIPEGLHTVEFDNGVVDMTMRQIHISWYYWGMYRQFQGAVLIKEGIITRPFTAATHRKLGSILVWHIFNTNKVDTKYTIWDLSKVFYEITNDIYNMSCTELSAYVTTTSIHDLVEILDDENVKAAKVEYNRVIRETDYDEIPVSNEIKKVHGVVTNTLFNRPDYLMHNGIKKLCLAGLVNKGQMVQLIGPRGYVHDIDGGVFPYPVDKGYAEGLDTIYDSFIESRSASRASIMNTDPLEQSEYFNRKVQLMTSIIMDHVHVPGGCTGYVTVPYLVEEDDLVLLKGKYHMKNGIPVLIWDTIDDLIGETIELRSITACGYHDVQRVCTVCLGWWHNIVPERTNLGFALATPLCAMISQTIMSTKHYEGSSISKQIELNAASSRWLQLNAKYPDKLYLTDFSSKGNLLIRIEAEYVRHLSQILQIDISELPISRLTTIPVIGITHTDSTGELLGPFDRLVLEVSGVGVHLSGELLEYIKEHGWGSGKGYIEISLNNWGTNKPIFNTPRKGDNIMVFFNDVKSFIEPNKNTTTKITDFRTRAGAINEFISILRRRLNKSTGQEFNIVQVEILVRAMQMVDYDAKRYELPHPSQEFQYQDLKRVLFNRSLTGLLAYQEQYSQLLESSWILNEQKTHHLLDDILDA